MKLFIDAFNIRGGGGITHLSEILNAFCPFQHDISKIYLCAFNDKITSFPDYKWIEKVSIKFNRNNSFTRFYWHQHRLNILLTKLAPDIIFSPGGILPPKISIPAVTMSQNLQPFDASTKKLYRALVLRQRLKMQSRYFLVKNFQKRAFKVSDGIIFLTEHGKRLVLNNIGDVKGKIAVIPHGINTRFLKRPRKQKHLSSYSEQRPFKFLYVSTINVYKHQWNVAEAVLNLRQRGLPVAVDFVGPSFSGIERLENVFSRSGAHNNFIRYLGAVPYAELQKHYFAADAFVFASSCETFGQVLLEAMAAGLPIASSGLQPMKEILGRSAIFFNPADVSEITHSLNQLATDTHLRNSLSMNGYQSALNFSWRGCAQTTFKFIEKVYNEIPN